jgi:endonuclease YncB( thermonuclease family)
MAAVVLLFGLTAGCGGGQQAPALSTTPSELPRVIEPPTPEPLTLTVAKVVDVRTVQLSDGEEIRIRGLAAPDQCWTEAATAFARTLLVDRPVEPTPAGNAVATLRLADGTDFAVLAVELGMARAEATDDRVLLDAEASASKKRLGQWGPPCGRPDTTAPPAPAQPPGTIPPTTAPKPVAGCSVAYRVTNTWPGGFRTDVTVANTGAAEINGWTLRWTFANGQTVSEMWNATPKQSGQDVAATAVQYNQAIPAGQSLLLGFTGTSGNTNAVPRAFTLNGQSCAVV